MSNTQVPAKTEAQLLRMSEVAKVLGVSTFTVRNLVTSGRLRSVRIGDRGWHRIRAEDVEQLISTGRVEAAVLRDHLADVHARVSRLGEAFEDGDLEFVAIGLDDLAADVWMLLEGGRP
jgi:excisionase family DNA binding protein